MAIYKGRQRLVDKYNRVSKKSDKLLLHAMMEAGDLLQTSLSPQTFIIALPQLDTINIHFLLISPMYGFRVIEVKAARLQYIDAIDADGHMTVKENKINPIYHVQKKVRKLQNYLKENYSFLRVGDPYRDIGYAIIFTSFSRQDFTKKFANEIRQWTDKEKQWYGKHHLFIEDITPNIRHLLLNATNYLYKEVDLSYDHILQIVHGISEGETHNSRQQKKTEAVEQKSLHQRTETPQSEGRQNKLRLTKKQIKIMMYSVMTVALFTIVFFVYQSMNEKSIRLPWKKQTYVQHENGAYDVGDLIIVQAEVQQVTFNEQRNEYELTIIADDKTITLKVDAANSELDVGDLIEIEGYIESMNDNDIQLELTEIISQ